MEQMVIAELIRQKEFLRKKIGEKTNLDDASVEYILSNIDVCLHSMINLMKEGKSAHEKFFSDIILNSIDAIIGLDNDFKIFLWNKGAENLFGYKKDEVMGKDFNFLIPDYVLEKGERDYLLNEVKEKGFLANHETERITKDGNIVNVSVTRFSVFNEKETMGSVGILRDLTTVKRLQKELREKENLALIGAVVSSIAHSLSNPLNIISGNADYLLLNKKGNQPEYEELETIVEEANRITKSLRGLLNFSRPLMVEKSECNVNKIIEEVIRKARFSAGNKDIVFKKHLDKELPFIEADKTQIEEVILNLVINSIQCFAGKGEIGMKTRSDGSSVHIQISDNGPGIPKENIEKIFQPFFSSKGYGKGTGLGLSIAKRIVEEHRGSIEVSSAPGKRTIFSITLPLK